MRLESRTRESDSIPSQYSNQLSASCNGGPSQIVTTSLRTPSLPSRGWTLSRAAINRAMHMPIAVADCMPTPCNACVSGMFAKQNDRMRQQRMILKVSLWRSNEELRHGCTMCCAPLGGRARPPRRNGAYAVPSPTICTVAKFTPQRTLTILRQAGLSPGCSCDNATIRDVNSPYDNRRSATCNGETEYE